MDSLRIHVRERVEYTGANSESIRDQFKAERSAFESFELLHDIRDAIQYMIAAGYEWSP